MYYKHMRNMVTNRHPECADDEVFLTNADRDLFAKITIQSKRLGLVAYDGAGAEIQSGGEWYPVFVKSRDTTSFNLTDLRRSLRRAHSA
jgi:hypothetical protein